MSYAPCIECGQPAPGPGQRCQTCLRIEDNVALVAQRIFLHGKREEAFDRWWPQVQAYADKRGCDWVLTTKEDHRDGFNQRRTPEDEVETQLDAAFYSR